MNEEQLEAWLASALNPEIQFKRRSLMKDGPNSPYVDGAVAILDGVFRDMSTALEQHAYLVGDDYSLADCALTAYVDRVRRLGLSGLYEGRFQHIGDWLARVRERPSYDSAIQAYYTSEAETAYLNAGARAWPEVSKRLPKN